MSSWDTGLSKRLSKITEPEQQPVSLDEAKMQTRRDHVTNDDRYLEDVVIPAARDRAEKETERQFISATWELTMSGFPGCRYIELPRPPLQSVTSVQYVDEDGATQTLSAALYTVDAPEGPRCARGRILLNYDEEWPSTRCQENAVTVRFVAGYGDTYEAIPPRLKMGMLLDIGTLYEIREDQIVGQGYVVSPVPNGSNAIYQMFKSYPRGE